MERFDTMYDNLSGIYSELESMMGSIYEELQSDPTNIDKANFLQGLGNVALKILSTQRDLVEEFSDRDVKDILISNIDNKASVLTTALAQSNNRKTR